MHTHHYRYHPDWIARAEMLRRFASRIPEQTEEPAADGNPHAPAVHRWPLPAVKYRHRSTFPRKPK